MAYTVTAPVTNNISLAERFLPILDEVYKYSSRSSVLDTTEERVRWVGAKTVNLYNLDPVGLGNYSRNDGFVSGDVTGTWEPYEIEIDRGRSYMVDVMDNDESMGMAFGSLAGTVVRQEVVPEVDAYRFAKYAGTSGILSATPVTIDSSVDVAAMLDAAQIQLDNAEVPYEGRILFVSPQTYGQLKNNITRFVTNGERNVNSNIEYYNDMRIITVPQPRFNTQVTLNAPTNSNDVGGYTTAGAPINFMIIHPSAVIQVVKHLVPRIFSPEVNQEADAWKFNYRIYHDAFVKANKVKGIYLSAGIAQGA